MADDMVRRAQIFVNGVYSQRIGMTVEEDGRTGWATMHALTRALQVELDITPLANAFGPTTLSTLTARHPSLNAGNMPKADFCRIIQSGLYCKGYDGDRIEGVYSSRVQDAMVEMKTNMGVHDAFPGSDLTPKVFKGLLTMDAYVVVNSGSNTVRSIQRWLNGRYINRRDFFVMPCDGHHSRDVAKSMLFAIQYELGMADGTANGVFGPGTRAGLRSRTVAVGSAGVWVQLFSAAMALNGRPVSFTSTFDAELQAQVTAFQRFVRLPATGQGDYQTWASLLVSYGDQDRQGSACDGVTRITPARAQTLQAAGINYVGRYLTSVSNVLPEKVIQPGELQTIAWHGMNCFPIYQTNGRGAEDFSYPLGRAAGQAAVNAALDHGFKAGTRIFFAVDFDALEHDIVDNVLPHFKGIEDAMADDGNRYKVGVYGARSVCTKVSDAGHATASFVSDLSSGFSGNFGYPLPENWAYDQFVTRTLGTGDGRIEIDNNIFSGRDLGQSSFDPPRANKPDVRLDPALHAAMGTDITRYMEALGYPEGGDGTRSFDHWACFQAVIRDHDDLITDLSHRHNMRKALIQTTAYWEMRHITLEDQAAWQVIIQLYNTTGQFVRDASVGIAKQRAATLIGAWNHCLDRGYVDGEPIRDVDDDDDKMVVWMKAYDFRTFALTSVAVIHRWDIDGKPGGDDDSPALRSPSIDYNDREIYEVLRRYQGPAEPAFTEARKRLGLYYVVEKYNLISRNL